MDEHEDDAAQVDLLARALQATSHRHSWKDCEFKKYFVAQAEALVERGVRVVSPERTIHG